MLYETNAPTADMTDAINAFNARYRGTDVGDTIWEQNNPEIFSELSLDEMPPLVDTTEPLTAKKEIDTEIATEVTTEVTTEVRTESGLDDNTFHGPNCECWNQEEHDHFCTKSFKVRFGAASPIDLKHQEGEHKANANKKHQQITSKQGQEKEQCKETVESEEEVWLNSDDEIMTLEEIEAEDAMHQRAATSFRDPIFWKTRKGDARKLRQRIAAEADKMKAEQENDGLDCSEDSEDSYGSEGDLQ